MVWQAIPHHTTRTCTKIHRMNRCSGGPRASFSPRLHCAHAHPSAHGCLGPRSSHTAHREAGPQREPPFLRTNPTLSSSPTPIPPLSRSTFSLPPLLARRQRRRPSTTRTRGSGGGRCDQAAAAAPVGHAHARLGGSEATVPAAPVARAVEDAEATRRRRSSATRTRGCGGCGGDQAATLVGHAHAGLRRTPTLMHPRLLRRGERLGLNVINVMDLSGGARTSSAPRLQGPAQENKSAADLITWREFDAFRNEMRRELCAQDDVLNGKVEEINQKLDATNATVTTTEDQVTDIHRNIADMRLGIENLTAQQQQDEDPELQDDTHNARGAPRGNRPRGWAPLDRHGRGHDEEDGLGKPKFSIPKFEGGADVEEYLTWELKIEKLWNLHPNYTEDKKIKLASSEFDGYALHWWDAFVRNRNEDGEQPIRTWHAMKEEMTSRFVPTNYLQNIYDKLTLLKQGVKTVDEYYMEMEMLMQRGRVRESLEMTMQHFLNGLKYDIKGIVRHYSYTNMNQLLHHAREAESQLADKAKIKGRALGAGRFTPRATPSTAPAPSTRSAPYSTPPSKPVSNVSNTKKSESAASTSASNVSTARNRDLACHTCGGKGHFRRDCPNHKVMIINEDNEYETEDDVDPNAPEDDDYDTDGEDAYPFDARAIVVSQRALNVFPSASTQRCNLFQTKALVGPDKACKVIIDGGSCRNLASKELCTKLKLKYLPHPHPYYIQWLSVNGEMKVSIGDEHRTRSRGAAGREDGRQDGREAGHGAGHEDISWTREEEREACAREKKSSDSPAPSGPRPARRSMAFTGASDPPRPDVSGQPEATATTNQPTDGRDICTALRYASQLPSLQLPANQIHRRRNVRHVHVSQQHWRMPRLPSILGILPLPSSHQFTSAALRPSHAIFRTDTSRPFDSGHHLPGRCYLNKDLLSAEC
ncbi:hypothetical protein QYE76_024825 [Lolium multiflorum]|uniref:CCHC-type domain-containing protein n=1 Tax=Lolium multiflorum TaxID=4521 RepID=A0AAD8VWF1_LOLMU|nr:hypothetical protein QYE76_024825 [Lolium multiflorum]